MSAHSRRLLAVDATRGLALLGMMAVHVLPAQNPDGGTSAAYLVASGRSAAAFAVLAGVGLALASGGTRPPQGRDRSAFAVGLLLRAALIGLVGLVLGELESGVAVILTYYGLLFALAVPLLGLRPRPAMVVAGAAALGVPVLSHLLRPALPPPVLRNPTLGWALDDPGGLLVELAVTGYYPALAWVTYLAAGLAVGRLPLRSARVALGLLAGGTALALAGTAASAWLLGPAGGRADLARQTGLAGAGLEQATETSQYGSTPTDSWWWLALDAPHASTPPDLLHTTGTALALLGALLLLARAAGWLLRPLAAAGSVTLSLYSLHVWALSTDRLPTDPVVSWTVQVALALAVAVAWRRLAGRGPLEAVVAAAAGAGRDAVRAHTDRTDMPEKAHRT